MTNNWQLPPDFIQEYLDACKLAATDDEAFKNFRKNDRIATIIENTTKEWSDQAMEKMGMTPTMVRYWYTVELIERLIGRFNRDASIVEIGGGYGGMCRILKDKWVTKRYTIFDLSEVCGLQSKYLSQYDESAIWYFAPWAMDKWGNLCISWCAWSELSYDLRVEYTEKVISKCDHFFICSNYNKAEDLEILSKHFTGIKEYNDELVQNVIYA